MTERLGGETPRGIVTLWLREGRGWRREVLPHPTNVVHSAFNADDSRLFTFSRDSNVRVWRTSDGGLERTIAVPQSLWDFPPSIVQDAFRPDCGALLLGYGRTRADEHLQLFDLATGELTGKPFALAKIAGRASRMRFSPDGTRLACVGNDQKGTIIDFQTGELAAPQFKHGGSLFDLDWSPDSTRLITAGLSPEIKLWDAATGEMLLSPMFLSSSVMVARWSADGRFIVGRSEDRFVRVWDATTTEAVTPMLRHSGYIEWMCITPGNRLITASGTNLLRSWNLKPTALAPDVIADYATLLAGRRLGSSGTRLPVKPAELEQLHRSLRSRAPQLFESGR